MLAVLVLGAYEAWLRAEGGEPGIVLTKGLWARQLERALADDDPDTTIVLGASRILGGFSSAAFHARYPDVPLYSLARSGETPMAALRYLANETDFAGSVVVDLDDVALAPDRFDDQRILVDYVEDEWTWNQAANLWAEQLVASRAAARRTEYALVSLLHAATEGHWIEPRPQWRVYTADHEAFYDFALAADIAAEHRGRYPKPHGPVDPGWIDKAAETAAIARHLAARGAAVAFVRYPTDGAQWTWEAEQWPRAAHWDVFAAGTEAITVHFADHAALLRFDLPDNSHLDRRDKDAFTAALLAILADKGMTFDRTPNE